MVVADSTQQVSLVEIGPDIPLASGPQGFFKLIEIGVNNYDPHLFMKQKFTVYFFRKDDDNSQEFGSDASVITSAPQTRMMTMSESELMRKRLET